MYCQTLLIFWDSIQHSFFIKLFPAPWGHSFLCSNYSPWQISMSTTVMLDYIFNSFIVVFSFYLFIYFKEMRREEEREGEISTSCLSQDPSWSLGLQPRHEPWPGIEPVTFWFAGQCSINWATPSRTVFSYHVKFTIEICNSIIVNIFSKLCICHDNPNLEHFHPNKKNHIPTYSQSSFRLPQLQTPLFYTLFL